MIWGFFWISALTMWGVYWRLARRNRHHNDHRNHKETPGFCPEGVALVLVVLVNGALGFLATAKPSRPFDALNAAHDMSESGLQVLAMCGALYALSWWRETKNWPTWTADGLVILAALMAIVVFDAPTVGGSSTVLTIVLTVALVWSLARLTANLNRTPQMTDGYLGLMALALLLASYFEARFSDVEVSQMPASTWSNAAAFSTFSSAALAGAGLATAIISRKVANFNLGWSASLAMGFLLAQIAIARWLETGISLD